MTEELKPVNCGCGGEAQVDQTDGYDEYKVYCPKCFMSSGTFNTEAEAVTTWNRAMRDKDINVPDKERTAKVKNIQTDWHDDEYINDRLGEMYHFGDCDNCGETVTEGQKYCQIGRAHV